MLPSKFSRAYTWASLLLLVALLLPVHVASAQDQPGACDGTNVQSAQVAAVNVPADQPVTMPKELVDLAVFQANWGASYKDAKGVESLIDAEFFGFLGNLNEGEYARVLAQFHSQYQKALPPGGIAYGRYDEIVHTMLDVALQIPEMRQAVPGVWKTLSGLTGTTIRDIDAPTAVAERARRYSLGDRLLANAPAILKKVYDCAQKNPAVAAAFDKQNSATLKSSIRDSAKQVIAQNPNLPILKVLHDRIGADGSITISINELKDLSKAEFTEINLSIEDMQQTLSEIDAKQDVLVDYVNNQQEKEKMQALAAAKAAEHKLKLDAAQSSLLIIHTLVGFVDPKLATQIATVGTSALQIAESMNGWLDAVAGLDGLDKLGSLSTVVMTGNVLGAVMNIVSLFGSSGPTPDQMILAEIGKLRQDVSQLRTEMHGRFDRIDKELNTIYTTMQGRFDLIDIQLGKITGKLDEIQK